MRVSGRGASVRELHSVSADAKAMGHGVRRPVEQLQASGKAGRRT